MKPERLKTIKTGIEIFKSLPLTRTEKSLYEAIEDLVVAYEQAQGEIERLNGEIEDLKVALCDPLAQHEWHMKNSIKD